MIPAQNLNEISTYNSGGFEPPDNKWIISNLTLINSSLINSFWWGFKKPH